MKKRPVGSCEFCGLNGGPCIVCEPYTDAPGEVNGYELLMRLVFFGGGFFLGCAAAVVVLHYWK